MHYSSKSFQKMVFRNKSCRNMIFLVLSGQMIFLFPENMILPQTENDLSQKNTRRYGSFFKCSEKMVFSKRITLGHDLSCTIPKDGILSQKHDIFSLDGKSEVVFLKKYMERWVCVHVQVLQTWRHAPPAKKIKDGLIPQKYT